MSQEKLDHVVAGAIFDFMGWLTTRQEKLVLSSADDAAPAAEAVKEFLTMRGVAQDCEPMIHGWPARCSMVTANTENQTNPQIAGLLNYCMREAAPVTAAAFFPETKD
jgi:hypothetical protein